jgi:hypothetical protein
MTAARRDRVTLTPDDVPTLRRLARFFEDRKNGHGFINHFINRLIATLMSRIVRLIELRGEFSSDERVDRSATARRR